MKLPTGKMALILWTKTVQDMQENVTWNYTLPPHFNLNFTVYSWNYSQTNTGTPLANRAMTLGGSPVILVET